MVPRARRRRRVCQQRPWQGRVHGGGLVEAGPRARAPLCFRRDRNHQRVLGRPGPAVGGPHHQGAAGDHRGRALHHSGVHAADHRDRDRERRACLVALQGTLRLRRRRRPEGRGLPGGALGLAAAAERGPAGMGVRPAVRFGARAADSRHRQREGPGQPEGHRCSFVSGRALQPVRFRGIPGRRGNPRPGGPGEGGARMD